MSKVVIAVGATLVFIGAKKAKEKFEQIDNSTVMTEEQKAAAKLLAVIDSIPGAALTGDPVDALEGLQGLFDGQQDAYDELIEILEGPPASGSPVQPNNANRTSPYKPLVNPQFRVQPIS